MANFLYVDNSNVWIEGMHVSAARKKLAPSVFVAQTKRICDYLWKLDFGKLYEFADGDRFGRAVLFGSRRPGNEALWPIAKANGFEVLVYDPNGSNKEKQVDTSIATEMMEDSFTRMRPGIDEVTLVAGDSDHVPVVRKLRARGFPVDVVFWGHASIELKKAASSFVSLDPYIDFISLPSAA